jgi:hypothetical protein
MAESTVVRVKRDGQILHSDSGAARTYTNAYEPGDFKLDVPAEAVNLFLDRGQIGSTPSIRYGDEQPMTFGYSSYLRDLGDTANAYTTLPDILFRYTGRYVATAWTSTMGTSSDVFTVTTQLTLDGSPFGEADKTLTLPYSSVRGSIQEGDPSSVNVTGTSYAPRPTLS